jgi:hypothetical protein
MAKAKEELLLQLIKGVRVDIDNYIFILRERRQEKAADQIQKWVWSRFRYFLTKTKAMKLISGYLPIIINNACLRDTPPVAPFKTPEEAWAFGEQVEYFQHEVIQVWKKEPKF